MPRKLRIDVPEAMRKITESEIEQFAIELFKKSGRQYIYAPSIAQDGIKNLGDI